MTQLAACGVQPGHRIPPAQALHRACYEALQVMLKA